MFVTISQIEKKSREFNGKANKLFNKRLVQKLLSKIDYIRYCAKREGGWMRGSVP
jgi:hypothetical protein